MLVKRAIRALESDDYKKAAKKNNLLPELKNKAEALELFRLLPLNRLAFRVVKMETAKAKEMGVKPAQGVPVLQIVPQQEFGDDFYYTWFYEPVQLRTYVYAVLAFIAVFAIILYPLWPLMLRIGVWYMSMGLIGLLGVFFGIAIVRLILFVITYFVASPGLWIFPNLFEDVGFVDSFIPLYAWHGSKVLPQAKQKKKTDKIINRGEGSVSPVSSAMGNPMTSPMAGQSPTMMNPMMNPPANPMANPGAQPGANPAANPMMNPMMNAMMSNLAPGGANPTPQQAAARMVLNQKLGEVANVVRQRKEEILKSPDAPKTPEEMQALDKRLFAEAMMSMRADLERQRATVMAQQQQQAQNNTSVQSATGPQSQ